MIGQTIAHYTITEKIGEGGMGEVYRATDSSLKRDVALKFLPEAMAQDQTARRRFLREARSAAALDHPYICQIHEIGEIDGVDFIAMEYVSGQNLREKLAEGRLSIPECLRIASEISEALDKAQEKGIVHRDLKPANIMLTSGGHVKLMDFGLAKRASGAQEDTQQVSVTKLTREGSTLGTVPYMSPEQVKGQDVDSRSDIFSFGIVLYEMLAGVHPFLRSEAMETAGAILHHNAPPLARYCGEASELLEHTIRKMLAKEPDERYQSIHEVGTNLNRVLSRSTEHPRPAGVTAPRMFMLVLILSVVILAVALGWSALTQRVPTITPGEITSIAVLPLDNLMNDPAQDYFVDGMTEALLTELSKLGSLRVISRRSVMQYKGSVKPFPEIAQDLNVEVLVEGSVLWAGDKVRITAQLIAAAPERHLWAQTYDRDTQDVLQLHSELAQTIAREIKVVVSPEEQQRSGTSRVNLESYESYLKGRFNWNQRTRLALLRAIDHFNDAISKDEGYAPAYAALADSYVLLPWHGALPPKVAVPKAKAAALKALELDSELAEAHEALGYALTVFEWDWRAADQRFQEALRLNPNYSTGRFHYAALLAATGQFPRAIEQAKRAQSLDPISPIITAGLSWIYHMARLPEQGAIEAQKALDLDPNFPIAHFRLATAYESLNRYPEAISALEKAILVSGDEPELIGTLGHVFAMAGDTKQALETVDRLRVLSESRYVPAFTFAIVYAGLGMKDEAFEWLEKAFSERSWSLAFLNVEPLLDPIRPDHRFDDLLHRMGLEP